MSGVKGITDPSKLPVATDQYGPAMLALTPMQRLFVERLVETGCTKIDAATYAGYAPDNRDSRHAIASTLCRTPAVQLAIQEEARKYITANGPMAISVLVEIAKDVGADKRDRIKAATELLNRGGLAAVSQSHILVEHQMSDKQKDREIAALAAELGLDDTATQKLLGKPIDAEFTEIVDPEIVDPLSGQIVPPRDPRGAKVKNDTPRKTKDRALSRIRRTLTPEQKAERKEQLRLAQQAKAKATYAAAQKQREANLFMYGTEEAPDNAATD